MSQSSSVVSADEFEQHQEDLMPSTCGPSKVTTCGCVTRFDTADFRYTWVIEDFSALMELHAIGEYITSKSFGDNNHEFVLKLFPAGKDDDCGGYISLYLQIINCPNQKVQLRIRFSVDTPEGIRECSLNKSVLSINRGGIITASKFFHSDIVKSRFLRRGPREALNVNADITVFLESKTTSTQDLINRDWDDEEMVLSSSYDLPVECAATSQISDVLPAMLSSGRFADFVVVVEGREFNLHRSVLAATSQYFNAMLKAQTLEASEGRVELKDVSADVFETIVRYTYDVKRPQADEITMDLIKAVDMLMMDSLKTHCCAALLRDVNISNFAFRLQVSDFLNDDRLFRRLVSFLASNRKSVVTHPDWIELKNVHPKLTTRVLEAAWTYAETLLPYIRPPKRRRFGH
ncbi:BTB/POZ domain protein [Necator americanus]|uniref:BTB/POZ domain protein n=1 Tax=Necator americanus TaxID=51031 RepID=W2TAC5_NECAM|nr:BTB/POZ domain protein [Necator americanus]ETN77962.1 BTB/POZ domain protein [Necator americanus]